MNQEIADGDTLRAPAPEQQQLDDRDRRAVQDRPALRARAFQAGAAFRIPDRFHQGESRRVRPASGSTACCSKRLTRRRSPAAWAAFTRTAKSTSPRPGTRSAATPNTCRDAARRLELKQLEPGEDVRYVGDKVQISGQVAVMTINGLLTKVIFDHNPKNEFYVEESFPLKWMYPHLTPFGIIMKINRQPLPRTDRGDRAAKTTSSGRSIPSGSSATGSPTTPASRTSPPSSKRCISAAISAASRATGKFVRDDQAQKAFSKLRSSIAGVYAWRVNDPENQDPVVQQRMIKEADFAFRQAFAFCPYSPEAVFRYVNLLLSLQRVDDALLIVTTCQKLDPYNRQVSEVVKNLQDIKKRQAEANPQATNLAADGADRPGQSRRTSRPPSISPCAYLQAQQTSQALQVLDRVLNHPQAEANAFRALLQAYASIANLDGLQRTVAKLEARARANPADFSAAHRPGRGLSPPAESPTPPCRPSIKWSAIPKSMPPPSCRPPSNTPP